MQQSPSVSQSLQKRQHMLMHLVMSGKNAPALEKERKVFVAGCPSVCRLPLLCLRSHPILFLSPFASSLTSPICFLPGIHGTSMFPLTACSLDEILGLVSMVSVLLLSQDLSTLHKLLHFWCPFFHPPARPILTAHVTRCAGMHRHTDMHINNLKGTLHIYRTMCLLHQNNEFW